MTSVVHDFILTAEFSQRLRAIIASHSGCDCCYAVMWIKIDDLLDEWLERAGG